MKIALPTDHVSHMAKRTHLWKAQCTYPRNKYFLTYRNVLISKLQTALIFSIVISVIRSIQRIIMSMVEHLSSHQIALMHLMWWKLSTSVFGTFVKFRCFSVLSINMVLETVSVSAFAFVNPVCVFITTNQIQCCHSREVFYCIVIIPFLKTMFNGF